MFPCNTQAATTPLAGATHLEMLGGDVWVSRSTRSELGITELGAFLPWASGALKACALETELALEGLRAEMLE